MSSGAAENIGLIALTSLKLAVDTQLGLYPPGQGLIFLQSVIVPKTEPLEAAGEVVTRAHPLDSPY